MRHIQANPFPVVLADGRKIVGELCTCGHFRSEHYDTLAFGHGECDQCKCPKYTWTAMVFGRTKPNKDGE